VTTRRSRLAPSPTGSLHLGNASTFLINWAVARNEGWELIMRIEDLNCPQIKANSIDQTIDVLQWLGLQWDGPVQYQSQSVQRTQEVLAQLVHQNRVYHCNLSRKEMEQVTSAPHAKDAPINHAVRPFDIKLHNEMVGDTPTNWRFITQDTRQTIHDELCGEITFDPDQDFVLWTRAGTPSYQLAVVVDDHYQDITDVIRGNDLLQSAAWQEQLYDSLDWVKPHWWHVPLVIGEDGNRLAKRHGDSRLATYRSRGVPVERIVGLIAKWCGLSEQRTQMSAETFRNLLDVSHLPTKNMVFSKEDEEWLYA